MPSSQARNYSFTLKLSGMDDPTLAMFKSEAWARDMEEKRGMKFFIAGVEHGAEGYLHLQGTICYKGNQTMFAVKKDMKTQIVHLEVTRNLKASIDYCRKEDKTPIIIGNEPHLKPGERMDLVGFKDAAFAGTKAREMYDKFTRPMIMYPKAFEKMSAMAAKEAAGKTGFLDTKAYWVMGRTGTGKSAGARFQWPEIFNVMLPELGQKFWMDGYQSENEILLDDFAGEIGFRLLLRICDIYPMRVEVKGGYMERNWHIVVITSNKTPEECYPKESEMDPLRRRLTMVHLPEDNEKWPLPDEVRAAVEKNWGLGAAAPALNPQDDIAFTYF